MRRNGRVIVCRQVKSKRNREDNGTTHGSVGIA